MELASKLKVNLPSVLQVKVHQRLILLLLGIDCSLTFLEF